MARINITRKVAGSANVSERKWFDSDANQLIDGIQDGTKEINTSGCGLEPQTGDTGIDNNTVFVDSDDSFKLKFKDNTGTSSEIGSGGGGTNYDITYSCASGIVVGDVVYISSNDTVGVASNNNITTSPAVGVVISKPTSITCVVRNLGLISGLVGLSAGTKYYLGVTGNVTTTLPTATGSIIQLVGVAKNATTLLTTITYTVIENS